MKKHFNPLLHFIFLLVICTPALRAQSETKKWYFSNNLGLDFSSGTPSLLTNGALTGTAMVGCASIADASGNLLFYTDGFTVWNQTHQVMANGTGLLGGGVQSAIIIKQPGSANLYYVFTVGSSAFNIGARYSVVDMSLAAGQGSVVTKNILFHSGAADKLSYTKNCNGSDFWVMTKENLLLTFKAFPFNASGLGTAVTSTFTAPPQQSGTLNCGMKFSPNGNRLAVIVNYANCGNPNFDYNVTNIYDFNSSTGVLNSNNIPGVVGAFCNAYSCEFSPDGKQLYVSAFSRTLLDYNNWIFGSLYQYNFCSQSQSMILGNSSNRRGTLQLAPDGKIYFTNPGTNYIGVISSPNSPALSCACSTNAISTGTLLCGFGLPNFSGSFFGAGTNNIPAFSATSNTSSCLSASFTPFVGSTCAGNAPTSLFWSFGDPASGSSNYSSLTNPTHVFTSPGTYSVQLTYSTACSTENITYTQLFSTFAPIVNVNPPAIACGLLSATASATGGSGSYSYTWMPGAQNNSVAINLTAGIYTVSALDIGTGCTGTSTINLTTTNLIGTVSVVNAACYGGGGAALVNMNNGSGNYSYAWSNTAVNSPSVGNLAAGNYSVLITDQTYSCTLTKVFTINQPQQLAVTIFSSSANGCTNAPLNLYAYPSGGNLGYTYSWLNGPSTATYSVNQSVAGTYTYVVTVIDANNCATTQTAMVTFNSPPPISTNSASICSGNTATLIANGANNYTWYPGTNYNPNFVVNPASTAVYTLAGNSAGCTSYITTTVIVNPLPTATISVNNPVCSNSTLILNGGGGVSYSWTGPLGFSSNTQNPSIYPLSINHSGQYKVLVSDKIGCTSGAFVNVLINQAPSVVVSGNTPICSGGSNTLTAWGGNSYTWNGVVGGSVNVVSPLVTTSYTVVGSNQNATCFDSSIVTVAVNNCLTTGLGKVLTEAGLSIYPNPFNDSFTLETFETVNIKIYNALGMLCYAKNFEQGTHRIITEEFSKGVYFVVAENKLGSSVSKIIKK